MKNCPMFSLRSNSIELRFRSVRRGNFLFHTGVKSNGGKSKVNSNKTMNSLCSYVFLTRYARSSLKI